MNFFLHSPSITFDCCETMLLYYFASAVKNIQLHVDDDVVDKLNYYYTSSILIIFAILVSAKQYVGYPIQCWVPATFTEPMEQYTEHYCWVQNTYWLPIHDYVPSSYAERETRQIGYYQWVPFVLTLEALFFYLPCIIWRLLSWQPGIHVQSLVQMACDSRLMDSESRRKALETIACHVEEALKARHQISSSNRLRILSLLSCSRNAGAAVTCLYLCIKLLFLINIVGQIFLLNLFLGSTDTLFGFHILSDLLHNREWDESGNFPRVTMCDFEVKVLGNVHRHTVQCVLMINMFNEKIFLFLWFWFLILGVGTTCSLIYWLFISIFPGRQVSFVGKYLTGIEGYKMVDSQSLRRFVLHFLHQDGVFLLRMTAAHAGDLVCCDLSKLLWNNFCDNAREKMFEI
ncbi:Innexin unc-9 [Trichinella pseudospiralis]|uniref:Innexin n=2 Tax=Trichinella TaxID=6333 RepID=A0A0V1IWP8_TRIPS|nr:Innexin unc-9 [Trichinella pseudospiralis]KRZ27155.1 Innexin unc-9 [Trichinella pseudospiralis]KRZ27165.1 Innexin unc-9 [Trichinella pseudospiralis]